jgi:RNA polymerase sigma-70 factor (ECF subfamily)
MLLISLLMVNSGPDAPDNVARFARLYEEFMPKVFRYIIYRVNDKHTTEDLTSLVFEKALVKYKTFDVEKAAFGTWIIAIARNTVIDHFRRPKGCETALDEALEIADGDDSPDEKIVRAEELRKLRICLERLAAPEKEIISLKFGGELTNRAISRELKMSESNVGVIVFRAVRKLRDCFGWQYD